MKDIVKCSNRACGMVTQLDNWRLVPDKEDPRVTHQHCPRCDCNSFYNAKPGELEKMKSGAQLIALERDRQKKIEGWTAEGDDKYTNDELLHAAVSYISASLHTGIEGSFWPWDEEWFKPTTCERNLQKAGALIAAEIDRLQRAASATNKK